MSAPTTLEDLKKWIEGPLEVREGPKCAVFFVEKDGERKQLEYTEFMQSGLRIEGMQSIPQIFFTKEDAIKSFWTHFRWHAIETGRWHIDGRVTSFPDFGAKVIYWRVPPEADQQGAAWIVYARFCITNCDWPVATQDPRDAA